MPKRLTNDEYFAILDKIATNPRAYRNYKRFSEALKKALNAGFPINHILSYGNVRNYEQYPYLVMHYKGKTLLHLLAEYGRGEINQMLSELLQAGADPNILTPDGDNALIIAAYNRRPSVFFKKILQNTDDLNHINNAGNTAFGEITQNFSRGYLPYSDAISLTKLLIEAGADLDADGSLTKLRDDMYRRKDKKLLVDFIEKTIIKCTQKTEFEEAPVEYEYEI